MSTLTVRTPNVDLSRGFDRAWLGGNGPLWNMLRPGLGYLSARCHPWQHDNSDLLRMWLERNEAACRAIRRTPA